MRAIVCVDKNFGIGKMGQKLFNIRKESSMVKSMTSNGIVIMGRKSFESLPDGKFLNRKNIVLTRQERVSDDPDIEFINSVDEILCKYGNGNDIYVIGGECVYKEFLPYCSFVSLTMVNDTRDADCHFPNILKQHAWTPIYRSSTYHDDKEDVDFYFTDMFQFVKKIPKSY